MTTTREYLTQALAGDAPIYIEVGDACARLVMGRLVGLAAGEPDLHSCNVQMTPLGPRFLPEPDGIEMPCMSVLLGHAMVAAAAGRDPEALMIAGWRAMESIECGIGGLVEVEIMRHLDWTDDEKDRAWAGAVLLATALGDACRCLQDDIARHLRERPQAARVSLAQLRLLLDLDLLDLGVLTRPRGLIEIPEARKALLDHARRTGARLPPRLRALSHPGGRA